MASEMPIRDMDVKDDDDDDKDEGNVMMIMIVIRMIVLVMIAIIYNDNTDDDCELVTNKHIYCHFLNRITELIDFIRGIGGI